MKGQGRVILGFFLVFIIVVFSVMNTRNVKVNFGLTTVQWPLILIILGSAILGALIVFLTASSSLWKSNKEIKVLKKQSDHLKETLENNFESQLVEVKEDAQKKLDSLRQDYEKLLVEKQQEITKLKQSVLTESDK